jgi:N-methylhydantoinase A
MAARLQIHPKYNSDEIFDGHNSNSRISTTADDSIHSNNKERRVRVGIDVGGTFTKAVAIDMVTGRIIGRSTLPTTHTSDKGVSTGILQALSDVMNHSEITPSEIELISHSTTQAVNALLEGDTAKVGIIGMGVGLERSNIIKRTHIKHILLDGKGKKYIKTCYRYLDTSTYLDENRVRSSVYELVREGAKVIVVSEAYGVDDPSNEDFVEDVIRKRMRENGSNSIPVVAAHDLTGIYGLEIRTMTAVINASILPKATNTARFVESAVRNKLEIPKNRSIKLMKGDGGVTDIKVFETKPIITVLSGPAASVAGALLHLRILNGIFVEVGGTSTNVCVIKDGKPKINYATIMQHPTCIRSLDVRVANVAGGSIVMLSGDRKKKLADIGPRSAHIAGLQYSCFANPSELEDAKIVYFRPKVEDKIALDDTVNIDEVEEEGNNEGLVYAVLKGKQRVNTTGNDEHVVEKLFAITTTCAANALNLIPVDDYAKGNTEAARIALSILAKELGMPMENAAQDILDIATDKILQIMNPVLKEYKLMYDRTTGFSRYRKNHDIYTDGERINTNNRTFTLVGGGGGASVLVPYLAKKLGMDYKKAEQAEIISSIGVAAAMIYEERERTVDSDPKPEEISIMIEEVKNLALAKGALPESITIQSEYVSERSILRVTATGNMSLDIGTANSKEITQEEAEAIAEDIFGIRLPNPNEVVDAKGTTNQSTAIKRINFNVKNYHIFEYRHNVKKIFSFLLGSKKTELSILVLDKFGRVRLSLSDVNVIKGSKEEVLIHLQMILGRFKFHKKDISDGNHSATVNQYIEGKQWDLPPQVHLLDDIRLIDFSNLTSTDNLLRVIKDEVQRTTSAEIVAIVKK